MSSKIGTRGEETKDGQAGLDLGLKACFGGFALAIRVWDFKGVYFYCLPITYVVQESGKTHEI